MTSDTKGLDKRFLKLKSIYDINNKLIGWGNAYNASDEMIPVGLKKGGSVNKMMMGGYAKKNKKK